VLNNLRNKFDPFLEKVGIGFASLGFGPNFWTWMGLILSIISAIMFSLHSPSIGVNWYTATFLGGLFLLIAGFFDAVDGAVAKVTRKTSTLGAFMDSVIDKVSEIVVFIGILIGNFTNPVLVLVTLSLALLVSYTRARGESIGIDLKGKGIAERAERILILSIIAFIPFKDNISVSLWIISILAIITILERLKLVSEIFGAPLFSIETFSQIFKREDMTNQNYSLSANNSDSTKFNNDQSFSSKTSSNVREFMDKPNNKVQTKSEAPKPYNPPKASYIDKTDPNETGRNVAQIIFEQENEDKKTLGNTNQPPPTTTTTTTTTTTENQKKENNEDTAKTTENQKKENNEDSNSKIT
jgi:phosphatidylglycerophosphate synthase